MLEFCKSERFDLEAGDAGMQQVIKCLIGPPTYRRPALAEHEGLPKSDRSSTGRPLTITHPVGSPNRALWARQVDDYG